MSLAFLIYKYFPYGGLQRDFIRFVLELQRRGHDCRVYCTAGQEWRKAEDYRGGIAAGVGDEPCPSYFFAIEFGQAINRLGQELAG